jgi:hypothetical protein
VAIEYGQNTVSQAQIVTDGDGASNIDGDGDGDGDCDGDIDDI